MRTYLSLLVAIALSIPVFATHLMGGEATARHIGGYDFELQLVNYRDTNGIAMQNFADVTLLDSAGGHLDDIEIIGNEYEGLLPLFGVGVEMYRFTDTITVPGPGVYNIAWTNCCRNGSIINASAPLSNSIFVYVTITAWDTLSGETNTSPVFLSDPVVLIPRLFPWSYNPLPYDADGDSLSWTITKPLDSFDDPIGGWYPPTPVDSTSALSIDPVIGAITWTPKLAGNFTVAIQVDEFRDGVKIGSIVRDLQLVVINTPDSIPYFLDIDVPLTVNSYLYDYAIEGSWYSLTVTGADENLGDSLRMQALGEAFNLENSPASFGALRNGVDNQVDGTMNWFALEEHVRDEGYVCTFRVDDYLFANDANVTVYAVMGLGAEDEREDTEQLVIHPNPAKEAFFIRIETAYQSEALINIFSLSGQQVFQFEKAIQPGINSILVNRRLPAGMYQVEVQTEYRHFTKPLVISY